MNRVPWELIIWAAIFLLLAAAIVTFTLGIEAGA